MYELWYRADDNRYWRGEKGIIESEKTLQICHSNRFLFGFHAIIITRHTCRLRSPSRTCGKQDAWQILHLRASLINNRIAAYVLTNRQMGRDLRRGKYRIDRRTDQSGAKLREDRNHTALHLKQPAINARDRFNMF